ncbi:MAG: phosphoribosyltransferase [Roseofilum sp. SBFL]|uniref:phosphoribosyltransferase n=1 Tax=unclassified Roseofilum TaxID=2620099 RepID=UPI001B031527|nr:MULTISPECIES: phosphoribosyltransferase family protein [unclassified Roseofilum]MBP0014935.1 phosphoribosyltransferase [Roseofilum sp. SID3]MBP0025757.1 phosphoribosyltransferase [Roseofilum sp. SID2]MBP0037070.1 phosphoribosyltransferase [Roseofilum sp. SID1]MBP0042077.1 phosphoribosyltransferase [Roseofilum sp. SBFL]
MSNIILPFRDRQDAGEQLAIAIKPEIEQWQANLTHSGIVIVYALPRGGLPIAKPIAQALYCPLSVIVAKKITSANNQELAVGAVTACGQVVWSALSEEESQSRTWQSRQAVAQQRAQEQLATLSPHCPTVHPQGAIAILVDDGMATGMTMAVAILATRARCPAQIWVATPVAPVGLEQQLGSWCDRMMILATPDPFLSVSRFYTQFEQIEMSEAIACLMTQSEWL